MKLTFIACLALAAAGSGAGNTALAETKPVPSAEAIPMKPGYYLWPNAVYALDPKRQYRAIFDATKTIDKPTEASGAVLKIASELNALAAHKVPRSNIHFVVIFHGPGADAILSDAAYKSKYGISNPNGMWIAQLQKLGVRTLICGQHKAIHNMKETDILPGIEVAEAATMVLVTLANDGYAIIGS